MMEECMCTRRPTCRSGRLGLIWCGILFALLPYTAVAVFTGPQDTSVLRGTTATLYCRNPDYTGPGLTRWEEGGVTFANEGGVFGSNAKYDNFGVITSSSTPTTQLDLQISNTQISDEGTYECEITPNSAAATLKVEIEGSVDAVTIDGDSSGNPVILTASVESVLTSTARGFRPAVNLEWYKNDVQITTGVSEDAPTDNGDGTNDTSGTLTFTPSRQDNEAILECRTTGQVVAPAQKASLALNVQYVPVVSVDYSNEVITCSSDANPLATSKIILNGTMVVKEFPTSQGSHSFSSMDGCTVISCNATNTVGTGTATFPEEICPGYVEPTATPATKSMPPTKPPSAGQGLDTGAIIGIAVGVLVVVCIVIIAIIICYKKKIFCFDNNKTSNSSTSPKKQPSAKNADMIRNQPEVRQSVHNYDDEPKKPRVPRSNSGKPAAAAAAVPPEKEALRQNPPPHSKDRDHQNYPMDSRDGGPEHGGQAGINYADLEFQNRQGATNGHGRVHPREDEPTQYASILV